jgi:putative membrane protein
VALLAALLIRADLPAMLHTLSLAGWPLLLLVPWRLFYFLLYATGWDALLRPYNHRSNDPANPKRQASFLYLYWTTTVREAVDRLLPVASVGGSVIGVRLLRWRGIGTAQASSSVIVEILLTVVVLYTFIALGLVLLFSLNGGAQQFHRLLLAFALGLPVPVILVLLLRYGSVFKRVERFLTPLVGHSILADAAAALDQELKAILSRQGTLVYTGLLQLTAVLVGGSFECWFVLRLCGHPISFAQAIILESMTQATRHLAFFVPAGIGVQEGVLVLFGQLMGISGELALAVSMAKRLREVLCGVPPLLSWQAAEARRLKLKTTAAD